MPQIEEIRRPTQAVDSPESASGGPSPSDTDQKLTYTVTEAAAVLNISRASMYALIHREGFPTLRVGKRRLISRELLAVWVRQQAGG